MENCLNCFFVRKNPTALNSFVCARNPPSVTPLLSQDKFGQPQMLGTISYRPGVTETEWCGEYKPKLIS